MSLHRHPGGCIRQPDHNDVLPPSVQAHLAVEEASALGALSVIADRIGWQRSIRVLSGG